MSLQVYFDGTLIDEQYYTGLTNNYELFNENFKLGAVPSNQYILKIAKEGVSTQPDIIELKDNGTTFANLKIDNIEEKDYEYVYTLADKMVDLDFYYDASQIFQNGSTSLLLIVQDICSKVGLTLGTVDFRGYDKNINWYDNTRTARDYIGMVAELNGGFARIENDTLYFIKQNTNSVKTIDIDDCEDFKIGEYHKITRVVYELGALKYEFGDDTGNTLYLNPDNVYITEESEVEDIYNELVDFEFYSFSTSNCPIDYDIIAGDVITFTDGINSYPTIAQYNLEYFGGWIGGYDLDINTERQEETQLIGDKENIRNLKIIVDRQNNTITQVVEEVGEQNTKIAQTQQTVNELNSKIQDIADITTQQETIYASLTFTDINQSEPIEIAIHPTTTNISYLYPRSDLYPSDTLYMPNRVLRFTNTDTSEVFNYELPDDLLIEPNSGIYDEFYLGYDEQICQVTKRCKYNADGSVGLLDNEVTRSYTYPTIALTDGDYTIQLLGYNNAYMSIRLMAQNIYTTQFATKAEMNSEISQTASSITSTVSATYETKQNAETNVTSLSSRIKQTATSIDLSTSDNNTSAGILIKLKNEDGTQIDSKSANITLSGLVKFTDLSTSGNTTINGANITTGIIKSSNYVSETSGTSINLSTGVIDTKNFKVNSSGNITSTGGTIGGFTISSNKLYKDKSSLTSSTSGVYIGTDGISLGTGSTFKVTSAGALIATSANITGTITATSGTFQNCTITNSCSVPASTVSGTLASNNIPNLSASKITSGTMSGNRISGGSINASSIDAVSVTGDFIGVNTTAGQYEIGDYSGQSESFWILTGWTSAGGGAITFKGRNCTFTGGIITSIGGETTATAYIV